jgi:CRISPR/Cas system endoribonuclease Cas6 (RAMP superfamily)
MSDTQRGSVEVKSAETSRAEVLISEAVVLYSRVLESEGMQFFTEDYTAKRSSRRKAKLPSSMETCPTRLKQLGLDIDEIKVKLGNVTSTFDNGSWTHGRHHARQTLIIILSQITYTVLPFIYVQCMYMHTTASGLLN